MYRKILVPSDGTVLSEKAIMAAIQFAASHPGCKIVGLSVAEPLSFNQIEALTKSTESDYLLREQLSAQSRVKRIAEMAEEAGVPCETVVAQSTKPNEEIVRIADEHDCDCIFMAVSYTHLDVYKRQALYSKETVLQENKRGLQTEIFPDTVHFLSHLIFHVYFRTPFPAGFTVPFVRCIDAHLASQTTDRRSKIEIIDRCIFHKNCVSCRIDPRGNRPENLSPVTDIDILINHNDEFRIEKLLSLIHI